MKAHHRKKREAGGVAEYKQDLAMNPKRRTADADEIYGEAEQHTGRKHGGHAKSHKKHVGKLHGAAAMHHAGRKPRKSGGRAGSNMNPLSSAHAGTQAKGRHAVDID